jgi:hypothetical protein
MSKQINFFITPDDYESINSILIEKNVLISRYEEYGIWRKKLPDEISNYNSYYISDERFLSSVYCELFSNIENNKFYYYDELRSNILQFDLGGFHPLSSHKLQRGRLYFHTGYYNDDDEYIHKSNEFIGWCDDFRKVFKKRFLKRYEKEKEYWYSKSAIDWIEKNNAVFGRDGMSWIPVAYSLHEAKQVRRRLHLRR